MLFRKQTSCILDIKKKQQGNNGVGDISSLLQRHCQTNH